MYGMYERTYTHTHALTYICVHKHSCVRVRTHSYTHAHVSGRMHTNVHTRIMHVHTHTHRAPTHRILILVSRVDILEFQKFLTAAQIAIAAGANDLVAVLLL